MELTKPQASIKLAILESQAEEMDRVDLLTRFTNSGLPQEVLLRLQDLWEKREEVAGRVVYVGRVALAEIVRFIDENKNLAVGVALGAAVASLVAFIPVLGPIALALGIAIGGIAGMNIDKGKTPTNPLVAVGQDVIELARKFFELLISIFRALNATPAGA
jgi:hypothetical protein